MASLHGGCDSTLRRGDAGRLADQHADQSTGALCGDGAVNGNEQCDGTDLGGKTCQTRGFDSGSLACTATCRFDETQCHIASCGNGTRDPSEPCEGADLGGKTCQSEGFDGGTLGCNSNCSLDTTACYECGDGVINGAEQCDGSQLGGQTCKSLGFVAGTLSCKTDCTFDKAGCQVPEAGPPKNDGSVKADSVVTKTDTGVVGTYYELPNNDADCPANCRQIPWRAGSDLWNGGSLPVYSQVACNGLAGNGTTNDGPAIQTCINNAAASTAVYVPAGVYYVNTALKMKSNVALRGAISSASPYLPAANAAATTFKLGSSGSIEFSGGSTGSNVGIASGYAKGSTTLVMNAGHGFVVNDLILISENPDTSLVSANGDNGTCSWCGENDGVHLMAQLAQVTAVSGNTVTISRPLYYTFKAGLSPVARKITAGVSKAGLENIRLDGSYADHGAFIYMERALFTWVKGVETYDAGSGAKASHVQMEWSYGAEVRDSYFHFGRDSSSDRNYGIAFLFSNSDHKVENNILRNHRHSFDFEGGGSGIAVLYNYVDDDYTDDTSYLGSARTNHGAHPYMNLFEGNVISHIAADNFWGTSSHVVFFRNWLWGDETGTGVPSFPPDSGYVAVDVYGLNTYYSFVGNVLGATGKHATWSAATLRGSDPYAGRTAPMVYSYGGASGSIPSASTTSINHGNHDYKTNGVAYWEGGSNHTLRPSMYYTSKPAFFGSQSWPAFGPDLSPVTGTIPAVSRY